ncbi:major Facilitator Superfamily protein, partial [Vibrio parahaemolyticus V-223/04]
MRLSRDV